MHLLQLPTGSLALRAELKDSGVEEEPQQGAGPRIAKRAAGESDSIQLWPTKIPSAVITPSEYICVASFLCRAIHFIVILQISVQEMGGERQPRTANGVLSARAQVSAGRWKEAVMMMTAVAAVPKTAATASPAAAASIRASEVHVSGLQAEQTCRGHCPMSIAPLVRRFHEMLFAPFLLQRPLASACAASSSRRPQLGRRQEAT